MPTLRLLVCAWSLKLPVQVNCRLLPILVKFSIGGGTTGIETTLMLPSSTRLLVQVAPPPLTVRAAPFSTGWLNSVNLSPTARAGPRFATVSVPVPLLFSAPLTTTRSLDGDSDLFTSMARLPPMLRSLLIVRVPTEAPGASVGRSEGQQR